MIEFVCGKCGTKYRTPDSNLGKTVLCKKDNCKSSIIIELALIISPGEIPPEPAKKRMISAGVFGAILVIACFFKLFFPIPFIVLGLWATWLMIRKKEVLFLKLLTSLCNITAIGLFSLLLIMAILNLTHNDSPNAPPFWLLRLDNFLIWSRENLKWYADLNIWIFLLVTGALLILSLVFPRSRVLERYSSFQETQGKVLAILIVITSFTFFAPAKLDRLADNSYLRWYKAIYREELKQERASLITQELTKVIYEHTLDESTDTSSFQANINSAIYPNGNPDAPLDRSQLSDAAASEATGVMKSLGFDRATKNVNEDFSGGGEEVLDSFWNSQTKDPDWVVTRKRFVDHAYISLVTRKKNTDRFVESLKSVYMNFVGKILPSEMNELLSVYLGEYVNTIGEYVWDRNNVSKIVDQILAFVNSNKSKINLFGWISGVWKSDISKPPLNVNEDKSNQGEIDGIDESKTSKIVKYCSNCKKIVPSSCHAGMFCPHHCGAFWDYEIPAESPL